MRINSTFPDLVDFRRRAAKADGRDGDMESDIIEIMMQINSMMGDATVRECNEGKSHTTTIRSGLPEPTWRSLYQGVQPNKGTTVQVTDTTGFLESWNEIDAKLVELEGSNAAQYRMDEAAAQIQGLGHEVARTLIYGDQATHPKRFTGLVPRFNAISGAQNRNQIIDAGGTGSNNTSIWFVTWGPQTCHMIVPQGSAMGIMRDDKGMTTKEVNDGSVYDVYREKFSMDVGLTVRDYRSIVRIANINVANLANATNAADNAGADLYNLMLDAYYQMKVPARGMGQQVIYCTNNVAKALHKQAWRNQFTELRLNEYAGMEIPHFQGIPIRREDAILETEGRVT